MQHFNHHLVSWKRARAAFAAASVAALVGISACRDSTTSSIVAPAQVRQSLASSGISGSGKGYAGRVEICVDDSSPAGTYMFTNSAWNSGRKFGTVVDVDNTQYENPNPANRGITTFPNGGTSTPYQVVKGEAGCKIILLRSVPSLHYNAPDPAAGFDIPNPMDDWQAVNVLASSMPPGVVFDRVDCVLDVGTFTPSILPVPQRGCGSTSNPLKAYANYDHGTRLIYFFKGAPVLQSCELGYPDQSHLPQSMAAFNESEVLRGFAITPGKINAIYSDEHALTLGVRQTFTNNKSVDVTQNFSIATMSANMTGARTAAATGNPVAYGSTITSGAGAAVDGAGRPLFPALFITDLTVNGSASRAGDWQQGGTPIAPNAVYGSWKGAKLTIDNTKNPALTTITPDADPSTNGTNFGPGAPLTSYPAGLSAQDYSADVVWNISSIPDYNPAHSYRAQFMVHDGDQNKIGGDVGQACVNIVPGS
jgi:hypothetical protein